MNPILKMMLPAILPLIKNLDFSSFFVEITKEQGNITIFLEGETVYFSTEKQKEKKDLNQFLQEQIKNLK